MTNIGFGDSAFNFAVYIANKPNMLEYQRLNAVMPLVEGEINAINQSCGNGWRKVFNVYAKLLYALDKKYFNFSTQAPTWQDYRDKVLLQAQRKTALLFSAPKIEPSKDIVHIICGKGHAKALISNGKLKTNLVWLDDEFAIDSQNKLIVCPYFDYRQLSNIKIARLADLLTSAEKV
ncbi:DUF6942 family protein [Colwellia sp. TT2012]|uniref:DUF6942 family protein n=1 Tax=Colwellia sp. TT2012 TaxID=1720342 RepID=UPI00070D4BD6|nr:hypothetical protein [Colwellia sp. TT2012]